MNRAAAYALPPETDSEDQSGVKVRKRTSATTTVISKLRLENQRSRRLFTVIAFSVGALVLVVLGVRTTMMVPDERAVRVTIPHRAAEVVVPTFAAEPTLLAIDPAPTTRKPSLPARPRRH